MKFIESPYKRNKAIAYAQKWALSRNPSYYNFDGIGGDCTNFISQCLYAGGGIMNHRINTGWYYYSVNSRAPSWTSVDALYRFITSNKTTGPYGYEASVEECSPGDFIQLATVEDYFHHSVMIVEKKDVANFDKILVSCHTDDFRSRPLGTYDIKQIRFIKIEGIRKQG